MKRMWILMLPFVLFMAACSSTNITNSWKDENMSAANMKKVLVLAMVPEKERNLRQQMENEMADNLRKQGYTAVSAFEEFGPKAFAGMKETDVMKQLCNSNIDGVITMVLLDTEKEESYNPGSVRYEPYAVRYNRFYGYFQTFYQRVYTPGYYTSSTRYFFETNLWDVRSNKMLYSAQSESFDPNSAGQIAKEVAEAVLKDMQKKNVLAGSVAKNWN